MAPVSSRRLAPAAFWPRMLGGLRRVRASMRNPAESRLEIFARQLKAGFDHDRIKALIAGAGRFAPLPSTQQEAGYRLSKLERWRVEDVSILGVAL